MPFLWEDRTIFNHETSNGFYYDQTHIFNIKINFKFNLNKIISFDPNCIIGRDFYNSLDINCFIYFECEPCKFVTWIQMFRSKYSENILFYNYKDMVLVDTHYILQQSNLNENAFYTKSINNIKASLDIIETLSEVLVINDVAFDILKNNNHKNIKDLFRMHLTFS